MKKNEPKKAEPEQSDAEAPSWVTEPPRRKTPYTDEEIDALVDGTAGEIKDKAAWREVICRAGLYDARLVLWSRLIDNDALDTIVTWH